MDATRARPSKGPTNLTIRSFRTHSATKPSRPCCLTNAEAGKGLGGSNVKMPPTLSLAEDGAPGRTLDYESCEEEKCLSALSFIPCARGLVQEEEEPVTMVAEECPATLLLRLRPRSTGTGAGDRVRPGLRPARSLRPRSRLRAARLRGATSHHAWQRGPDGRARTAGHRSERLDTCPPSFLSTGAVKSGAGSPQR